MPVILLWHSDFDRVGWWHLLAASPSPLVHQGRGRFLTAFFAVSACRVGSMSGMAT